MILALFKIAVIQTFHPSISLQWDFSLVSCLLWEEVRSRLERFLHHHISFCVFYYPDGKWRVIQQFRLTVCDERSLKSTDPDMIWIGNLTVLGETCCYATRSPCILTSASWQTQSCESAAQHTVLFSVPYIFLRYFSRVKCKFWVSTANSRHHRAVA